MKAIILKAFGGLENFEIVDLPIPKPTENQVLIRTLATSVNPIDVKTRSGKGIASLISDQMPVILGWDIAGTITDVGPNVNGFKIGDEVFGMIAFPELGKTYAEYTVANSDQIVLKPKNISPLEAAAIPLAALTAWQAITYFTKINMGDRVLIHAASGGVGHYAIQIAKYFGAYVIGTSSAANKDFVLSLGADEHIDYQAQPFENVVKNLDYVLDCIGGEYIDRSLKVISRGGTIVCIPSGLNETVMDKAEKIGVNGFIMKAKPSGVDMAILAELIISGFLRSHVSKIFPITQIHDAHKHVETGRTIGKVVIKF